MHLPLVSVIMSVRNGSGHILKTIHSILEQKDIDLEFIIVDDGSTDNTIDILSSIAAKDFRIKLLSREGRGLTVSLIEACEVAKGEFIARQDAYDYSMPERLYTQATSLVVRPNASLCSSHVRFITKERASILIQSPTESDAKEGLTGIIHGSTMFRKKDYLKVGGYRKEFYYAQDVDLWSRLVEVGEHIVIPYILYENCLYPDSISGLRRKEQTKLHSFIVRASQARRSGGEESKWLSKASLFSEKCRKKTKKKVNKSSGAYFIGACLINSYPLLAKKYLRLSLESNPFNIRARLKMLSIK